MDYSAANKLFFEESRENVTKVETCLLFLEDNPQDQETINELFRAVHTIKGSSGMFGYEDIMHFTHVFETIYDCVRHNEVEVSDDLISVSLEANDHVTSLLDFFEKEGNESKITDELAKAGEKILVKLNHFNKESASVDKENAGEEKNISENEKIDEIKDRVENKYWHISIRFFESTFKDGFDPFSFLNYLLKEGEIISLLTIKDNIPDIDNYDPENCYLGFEIVYDTELDKTAIADVFEFVEDDCSLKILPPRSSLDHYIALINNVEESKDLIGEILVQSGALTEAELAMALEKQAEHKEEQVPIGEIIVDERMTRPKLVETAVNKQKENRQKSESKKRSMRIDVTKIDHLIRFVGELVIASANLKQLSEKKENRDFEEVSNSISRLVEEIRERTMNVRMVQIGETFATFKRVVRDLSRSMNKDVDLEISGGETELDKNLVELIQDPIMHLVRNSIDHGFESKEERVALGKPESGKIGLNAYYESGSVVIEVSDDGRGLNREKILEKALANGIIEEGVELSDKAVWDLIFAPGFSTAQEVSSVSGRGVGMDVVKNNVESLRGMIDIETEAGEGTIIRMHLPLTLAIIDGFLIKVEEMHYIVPLEMVVECIDITEEINLDRKAGDFFSVRGEIIPFVTLSELFKTNKNSEEKYEGDSIIIVKYARKSAGLLVDQLLGKFQAVIKPLGKLFKNLNWISGATILGDGSVALILDIPRLINHVQETKAKDMVKK
jgi:two-component system chemotaxis sensor kinase CheA